MISKYESLGLNIEWDNREYIIPVSAIAEKYKVIKGNFSIKPLSEVGFDKYAEYDAKVYGLRRLGLLKKWTALPESFTWLVINENDDVVGCITVRKGVEKFKQYALVGPLFSDNLEIAKKLMYTASQTMSSQKSAKYLWMCIPTGISNAIQMVESDFGVKCNHSFPHMCSRKPKVDISKVIAIHSPDYS